ncbi:FAD/NAD(P)-binding protein [Pseudomonas panipatensis]|uniref:FAD/NAD(P)-binding protein n=1 Tax=Pseudomonas panipatensis TaxID=428992 RepID=UPI0035B189B7
MEQIAIIGSGFCGTALAIQLLQRADQPLQLTLINRSGRLARGLAYGTRSASHILNVPAERMSLFPERPGDFLEFARTHMPGARPGDFLPRRLYGDYLEARLGQAIANARAGVRFTSLAGQVLDLREDAGRVILELDDGQRLDTHHTVIATGNFAPATPAPLHALGEDPRYIRDPWSPGALEAIPATARVLLLGTGLTMYDMALALQDHGHSGPLLALSRRALLPHAHRDNSQHPSLPTLPAELAQPGRLNALLGELRAFVAKAATTGHDWRDVVAALRPVTPLLWQGLDGQDRARFLRHLQPYWDVHRHRAAPPVAQRMADLRASGQLQVQAGRIMTARADADGLHLQWRRRGATRVEEQRVDYLINCTGPSTDLRTTNEPLLESLLARGVIQQDRHCLGLRSDADFHLLAANGEAHPHLFLLSPMLRANHWESTAVPELREHAERLAGLLLRTP